MDAASHPTASVEVEKRNTNSARKSRLANNKKGQAENMENRARVDGCSFATSIRGYLKSWNSCRRFNRGRKQRVTYCM